MSVDSNIIQQKFFKLNELAKFLRVSNSTVYRLVTKRSIPFHEIGGQIRFDVKDIADYLKNNRVECIGSTK
ncbi:MAG: helix-turn-helix domain-containing protein [Patescibacteria group bacterium]